MKLEEYFFVCKDNKNNFIQHGREWQKREENVELSRYFTFTFTFMHLADAFIQSDLQCIQAIHFFYHYVCSLGIEPTTFCAANAMLYHWATGTLFSLHTK